MTEHWKEHYEDDQESDLLGVYIWRKAGSPDNGAFHSELTLTDRV